MDQILNQLGGLVLGSLPTVFLFVLLVAAYGLLVRRPLDKVLAERVARTTGAVEQARGAMAAAEAETKVYEDKLRNARAEIFQTREQKSKEWAAQRDIALEQVRRAAGDRVRVAKLEIEQSSVSARTQIEGMSDELSAQVLRAVLPMAVSSQEVLQ